MTYTQNSLFSDLMKDKFSLQTKISIHIPSIDTEHIDRISFFFAEIFGAAHTTQVKGYWSNDKMGMVEENTTIVYGYCDDFENDKNIIIQVFAMCEALKNEFMQESITLEVNGKLYFV